MACCGDVHTMETLAAVTLLRRYLPEVKVLVVNVVDLMKLQPRAEHRSPPWAARRLYQAGPQRQTCGAPTVHGEDMPEIRQWRWTSR